MTKGENVRESQREGARENTRTHNTHIRRERKRLFVGLTCEGVGRMTHFKIKRGDRGHLLVPFLPFLLPAPGEATRRER